MAPKVKPDPKAKPKSVVVPPPVEATVIVDVPSTVAHSAETFIEAPPVPADAPVRICPTDKSRSFTEGRCDTCGLMWAA